MGYTLEAFVARGAVFDLARTRDPVVIPVELSQGFVLVPLNDGLHDSFPLSPMQPYLELYKLSPALADWASELSRRGSIAYLEAEFFGGTGTHASIVWSGGKVVLGPLHTEIKWEGGKLISPPLRENAFNRALRHLGAESGDALDEFEAVGLGRHRLTESWVRTEG